MRLLNDFFSILKKTQEESAFSFSLTLNPDHPIYQAHFPGHPVTPGVCIIQIATECAEEALDRHLNLVSSRNIKFLKPILPSQILGLSLSISEDLVTRAEFTCEGVSVAKMSLEYE